MIGAFTFIHFVYSSSIPILEPIHNGYILLLQRFFFVDLEMTVPGVRHKEVGKKEKRDSAESLFHRMSFTLGPAALTDVVTASSEVRIQSSLSIKCCRVEAALSFRTSPWWRILSPQTGSCLHPKAISQLFGMVSCHGYHPTEKRASRPDASTPLGVR